jgi:hypothetical protein
MTHYRHLTLGGDIMFVNKIPFFMSITRHIRFGTDEMLQNQKSATILAAIKQIKSIYMKHGFKLDHMLMDEQFEPLRAELADRFGQSSLIFLLPSTPSGTMSTYLRSNGIFELLKNGSAVFITRSHSTKCQHA